jgi:FkbM family methyltransferase
MMPKLSALMKPEYLMNPRQLVVRLAREVFPPRPGRLVTRTPWGWPIEVSTGDVMGKMVIDLGLCDLAVSEVLWRLAEPGESALDVGANFGFMTALLARRVGPRGRVLSFEAHPEIVEELRANVARWKGLSGDGVIRVHGVALSDHDGTAVLEMPDGFDHNRGLSRVRPGEGAPASDGAALSIACATLDSFLAELGHVGVAKMDVEGHEESVLRGARAALNSRSVRDWAFEHHPSYPSPVTDLFEAAGYTLFQIDKKFFGVNLVPVSTPLPPPAWEARSYLATLEPDRARNRMKAGGWQVYRSA